MECRRCASPIERPGDYCLVCRTTNTDAVVLEIEAERATLTMLFEDEVIGTSTVTTVAERDEERRVVERRNFGERIADELRRKRPEHVYAVGDREILRTVQAGVHYEVYRVDGADPVRTVLEGRDDTALEVVDRPVAEKLGGRHTTVIGGRGGRRAIQLVASYPHVKKIVPGRIDAGGRGSQSGLRAKVTRADENGNVRLLLRDGSSVQENRVITTAGSTEMGERVRDDLNELLVDASLQEP